MNHLDIPKFLGLLVVILGAAKLFGALAQRVGQPAVLGELVAGVLLGISVGGLVDPNHEILHLFSEIGVVILLFETGLETDLRKLLRVGGAATAVAIVGVVLPFALGFAVCRAIGVGNLPAVVAGAALTATSVGITARVLSDLNRLQEPESHIILGAAIIDDVIGLVILALVAGLTNGEPVTVFAVAKATCIAFGFLAGTLLAGRFIVPSLIRLVGKDSPPAAWTTLAIMFAFGLAWLAAAAGSAMIIGAFAAGLLLRESSQVESIERGISPLGHFFVPIFFVVVGSAVDVRTLNPFDPTSRTDLLIGGMLIVAAVVGKFLAGYAPFWFQGNKKVIGAGMIPRGEVGLIFAQMGLTSGVFDRGLFSAVTLTVVVTTFIAPPLLKYLSPPIGALGKPTTAKGVEDLVTEA